MRELRWPTDKEIAFDRWTRSPDRQIVLLYRRVRRWLGLGCYAIPWKDALPIFTCSRPRKHSGVHVAKTPNGPIAWDVQWSIPAHEGLVRLPSKKKFDLAIASGNHGESSVFTHHVGVHTEEEHTDHLDFAVELDCIAIANGLHATRTMFFSDETLAALAEKRRLKTSCMPE